MFKQKTAYEVRISDWSSDVCSSDLEHRAGLGERLLRSFPGHRLGFVHLFAGAVERALYGVLHFGLGLVDGALRLGQRGVRGRRSEEHTSELQSLMRISYAVFCLTNKQKVSIITHT